MRVPSRPVLVAAAVGLLAGALITGASYQLAGNEPDESNWCSALAQRAREADAVAPHIGVGANLFNSQRIAVTIAANSECYSTAEVRCAKQRLFGERVSPALAQRDCRDE
jgi:hypothetical protein